MSASTPERLAVEVSQMRDKLQRLESALQIKQAKLTKQLLDSKQSKAIRHDYRTH